MQYKDIELEKLKKVEVELLKTFIEICQKYHLTYYLTGGTLLGAIRHKGFIPWDDDIDICMKRSDYIKFKNVVNKELPSYYFFQDCNSDINYKMTYAKIRDSRTTFIENSSKNTDINHGVYIDIFPLDNLPKSKYLRRKMITLRRGVNSYCQSSLNVYKPISTRIKQFFLSFFFLFQSSQKVINRFDKLCLKYGNKDSDKIICYGGIYGNKDIFNSEWFNSTCEVEFEHIKVSAPIGYDAILKQLYKDYMSLPPVEKRVPHHEIYIFDLDKSYKNYIK